MLSRVCVLTICVSLACAMSLGCASETSQRKAEPEKVTETEPAEAAKEPVRKPAPKLRVKQPEPSADQSLLTVYSSPRGKIMIGGQDTGEETPATVEIKVGEVNKIQVQFADGSVSEAKEVTGKAGTRYKVMIEKPEQANAD